MELRVPTDLPEDIGRLIFEAAAEIPSDGLACACACATVSKQVKLWVEPILYRDVEVDGSGLFHRTVTASRSSKPSDFFQTHVRALLFRDRRVTSHSQIQEILERCISVKSLALWDRSTTSSPELQRVLTSDLLAPTHLSLHVWLLGNRYPNTFSHPIFRNVTHLEPFCIYYTDWDWSSLSGLKQLTHLNLGLHFPTRPTIQQVANTLAYAPESLSVLVVSCEYPSLLTDEDVIALNRGDIDSRVVAASEMPDQGLGSFVMSEAEIIEEWARPSTARLTVWSLAEDVIRRRQALVEGLTA